MEVILLTLQNSFHRLPYCRSQNPIVPLLTMVPSIPQIPQLPYQLTLHSHLPSIQTSIQALQASFLSYHFLSYEHPTFQPLKSKVFLQMQTQLSAEALVLNLHSLSSLSYQLDLPLPLSLAQAYSHLLHCSNSHLASRHHCSPPNPGLALNLTSPHFPQEIPKELTRQIHPSRLHHKPEASNLI